jgi:DNA-binding CsgD family transcriptional regulator
VPDPISARPARVVLVGPPAATRALRETLEAAGITVVGEVLSPDDIPDEESHDAVVVAQASSEPEEASEGETDAPIEPLTAREREVLELVSEGLPNKAIASRLGVSDHTVKFHLSSIFGKLGVSTRTEAVRRAVRAGLINF